jgi:DNA-binding transcriptional MerR regulator
VASPPRRARKGAAGADQIPAADDLFHDGKEPGALRTIGEVATALGLRQHVLRYWEDQFPMLRPLTRAGGRRYYRPEDIALLIQIDRLLHREGYTIKGARLALTRPAARRARDTRPVSTATPLFDAPAPVFTPDPGMAPEQALVAALGTLRTHLQSIRDHLASAIARA